MSASPNLIPKDIDQRSNDTIVEEGITTSLLKDNAKDTNDIVIVRTKDVTSELYLLFSSSLPIMLASFIQFFVPLINLYSLGQFSSKEIAAAALGGMVANTTGWSICIGMATSLDTLCSQAFTGSRDKHQVGVHLQRGILISLLLMVPISMIWFNAEHLLVALGQDKEISKFSGEYLRVLIFGAPAFIMFECCKKFLQAQRIMRAQTWVVAIVFPLCAVVNYFLMWNPSTSVGFVGAALTLVSLYWMMFFLIIIYIAFVEGSECWGGWSWECLTNWSVYLKLGFSGILMVCTEWWAWQVISLFVGYLGEDNLAAHYISLSIDMMIFSIPVGISVAASNRSGNLLGSGHKIRSKISSQCALFLSFAMPASSAFMIMMFKEPLSRIFTSDSKLQSIIITLLPLLGIYHVFDSICYTASGILRGQGRQKVGAFFNVFVWYCFAIPISIYFAFTLGYGVRGMWFGLCLGLSTNAIILSTLILTSDWERLILDTKQRIQLTEE